MTEAGAGAAAEQLVLVRPGPRPARDRSPTPSARPAAHLPVARVLLDVPLAHLDRPFDYLVPETMAEQAAAGTRVKVRFAGQEVAGFVVDRVAASDHVGALTPLRRVVSPEPVLAPQIARLSRLVADRYAGTVADVLRLAVPPRHARAEKAIDAAVLRPDQAPEPGLPEPSPATRDRPSGAASIPSEPAGWDQYVGGASLFAWLRAGRSPRVVWSALPGRHPQAGRLPRWAGDIAELVSACAASGRGALVVVPDRRDVDLVGDALDDLLGDGSATRLVAELGPAERYRRWLAIRRGERRLVVGTRAAAFAPVADLGLVLVWDDGDDLHKEPRAPYPHARDVLILRARTEKAAIVVGGLATTVESAELVRSGWARPVTPVRQVLQRAAPEVIVPDASAEADPADRRRLPAGALELLRSAVVRGPVLVQVPRAGYAPVLACSRCRTPARCATCAGPLAATGPAGRLDCRWCGRTAINHQCPECGSTRLRAPVVGDRRTAEELGRALPGVRVLTSSGDRVLRTVDDRPAIVVATTGAEPVAPGGYTAALLLDGWVLLDRVDLRAGEEAVRRWMTAAGLVRPAPEGGRVLLVAPARSRAAQAMLRWDPLGFAEREAADRVAAGFPPAVRLATVTGPPGAVADLLQIVRLPPRAEVLGPVQVQDEQVRAVVRAPSPAGTDLARALHAAQAVRSARKSPGPVRVELDPLDLA